MLRGGLIGCGYISSQQLSAWQQVSGAQIVAVCDLNRDKAAAQAASFNIPAVYTDYRRMLDEESLDFVDIVTRPGNHLELVTAVSERGLQVLCQKPMAESMNSAEKMVAVCRRNGVMLMINENGRFQDWFRQMKQFIDQGLLGKLRGARFDGRWRATLPTPDFQGQPYFARMPRLLVFEMGVHYLDIARYLFGEAQSIYARLQRVSPHIAGEDSALLLLEFKDLLCQIDANWYAFPPHPEPSITWGLVSVEGTTGTLTLWPDGRLTLNNEQGLDSWIFGKDTIPRSFVAAQQHFVDCLRDNTEPETSGRNTLLTMALVFGAYDSSQTDRPFKIQNNHSS